MTKKSLLILLYLVLYSLASFLLLFNLSDRLLRGDEAETALLGRNILKFDIPKIDDGKNIISQYPEPWEANEHGVWTWNTWLPYYTAALSFKLFGESTFSARFPFVLVGLLAVILMRKAARDLYEDEETAFIATVLLAFSVPFLLHARQSRYFSLLSLGTIWLVIGYNQVMFKGSRKGGVNMALALAFLFYSSFISFVGSALGAGITTLALMRKRKNAFWLALPPFAVAGLMLLPWVLYSGMLGKGGSIRLSGIGDVLAQYLIRINFHIFPFILLLAPPLALAARRVPLKAWIPSEKTSLLIFLVAGNLASLCIFPFVYFRYLVTAMPALFLLEAHILRRFVPLRSLRYLLLLFLVATNIPAIISLYPCRDGRTIGSPIATFTKGLLNVYEDKYENILAFLQANARESDSVALMEQGYPLMFYTGMKTVDARYPRNAGKIWEADWVLSEAPSRVVDYGPRGILHVPEQFRSSYRVHILTARDTPLGANRPDPDLYQSLSADRFKPYIIYERIN